MKTILEKEEVVSNKKKHRPPRVPEKLRQLSYPKTIAFVLVAYIYFVGGALTSYYLWMSELDLFIKIPTIAASLFLAQQGLHLTGWVGHEGFHSILHKNKKISAYLGIILSTILFSFQQFGLAVSHWTHHAYTNQENDPDVRIFGKYKTFWSRLFLSRLGASRTYLKTTISIAFGKKIDHEILLPFKPEEIKRMARVNLTLSAIWMVIHISIIINDFMFGFICIILPHFLMTLFAGIRAYIEHADTGEELFDNTRNRINPIFTLFYFGNNYHLEHHLYPTIPCYNLPLVHRFLIDEGYFENKNTNILKGFFEPYEYTTSKYSYPNNFNEK